MENFTEEVFYSIQMFKETNQIKYQAIIHYNKSRKLHKKRNVVIVGSTVNNIYIDIIMYTPNLNSIKNQDSYIGRARRLGINNEYSMSTGHLEQTVVKTLEQGIWNARLSAGSWGSPGFPRIGTGAARVTGIGC